MELLVFLLALAIAALAISLIRLRHETRDEPKLRVTPNTPPNVGAWTAEDAAGTSVRAALAFATPWPDAPVSPAKRKGASPKTAAKKTPSPAKKAPMKEAQTKQAAPARVTKVRPPRS